MRISCKGDFSAALFKEFLAAAGFTFQSNKFTSHYPGVYANVAIEAIFALLQKWKSIESIFSEERTNDEFVELLKLMTHVDPVNQNGIKLSDFLTKSRYDSIIKVLCGKYRFNRFQQRHSNLHCSEGN